MSAKVSTLLNVDPGGGRYVFLLIGWNDYADPVRDELNRQADAFGMDLGPSGVLVQAYPQRMYEIAKEVLAKPWPPEIAERLQSDQDPIILILDRDWQSFDPREHPFRNHLGFPVLRRPWSGAAVPPATCASQPPGRRHRLPA